MAESFWESQAAVAVEMHAEQAPAAAGQAEDVRALTVSMDDFSALEERIVRAVEIVKRERQARMAAEAEAARAEARAAETEGELREQAPRMEKMEAELAAMRAERDQVRQRVERLLAQLDALEM